MSLTGELSQGAIEPVWNRLTPETIRYRVNVAQAGE
jgi:hypothetical protein